MPKRGYKLFLKRGSLYGKSTKDYFLKKREEKLKGRGNRGEERVLQYNKWIAKYIGVNIL